MGKYNETNYKGLAIYIFLLCLIPFFVIKGCLDTDNRLKESNEREKAKAKINREQFKFDVDSLGNVFILNKLKSSSNNKPAKRGIIVFEIDGDSNRFKYLSTIDTNLYSFTISGLNTIILYKRDRVEVGDYGNGKTKGYRNDFIVYLINAKSQEIIYQETLQGSTPPSEIHYRRSAPEETSGSPPDLAMFLKTIIQ